jgi:hypothetical protein
VARVAADIPVASGRFASQPLVFAHLWDVTPDLDLGAIDVIQGTNMRARLGGYFGPGLVTEILTRMEADNTLVLFLPGSMPAANPKLRSLGNFTGTLVRAS